MVDTIRQGKGNKFYAYRLDYSNVSEIGIFYNLNEAEIMLWYMDTSLEKDISPERFQIVLSDKKLSKGFFTENYPLLAGKYGF